MANPWSGRGSGQVGAGTAEVSRLRPSALPVRGVVEAPRVAERIEPVPRQQPCLGLLFDAGDVLFDDTVWRRWLLQTLSRLGLHTHYRPFFRVWDSEYLREAYCGRREVWAALRSFLLAAGLRRGQIDEVMVAAQARWTLFEEGVRLFPGVHATLLRLEAAGIPMAVACNATCSAAALTEKLERLGVGRCFRSVVSSLDVGWAMPDSPCYSAAIAALELNADQVAFVGHDAGELAGARREGMWAIAFNNDPEAEADTYLTRFDQLHAIMTARSTLESVAS